MSWFRPMLSKPRRLQNVCATADRKNAVGQQLPIPNVTLELGADGWPFPIPLVKTGRPLVLRIPPPAARRFSPAASAGTKWVRSMSATRMWRRNVNMPVRIGWEMGVLCLCPVPAQPPGTHDGLFWPAKPGEELSPLGPLNRAGARERLSAHGQNAE